MRLVCLVAAILCCSPAAGADEPPPGMIEIPNAPPPSPSASVSRPRWWLDRPGRRPIGINVGGGTTCVAATTYTGGCFGLVRVGFEFGWGDIHAGGLIGPSDSGYNPFTGRDEGDAPAGGLQLGAEVGSPFLPVGKWVKMAARGAIDHDLMFDRHLGLAAYAPTFTNNLIVAISLAAGVSMTARAGVGFKLSPDLVVDGGIGFQYAR